MQRKNLKLMVVSAVVIVVCLLFSWAYMDGGQVEQMRHAEVGDYMVLDCVDSSEDGEVEYILTATVVGEVKPGIRPFNGSTMTADHITPDRRVISSPM